MVNSLMIPSNPLTADQASGLLKILERTDFPGAAAPALVALHLALARIAEGQDVVTPMSKPEGEGET